jgi:hypothetical protein
MRRLARVFAAVVVLGICAVTAGSTPRVSGERIPFQDDVVLGADKGRHPQRAIEARGLSADDARALLSSQPPKSTSRAQLTPSVNSGQTGNTAATSAHHQAAAIGIESTVSESGSDTSITAVIAAKRTDAANVTPVPSGNPYREKLLLTIPPAKAITAEPSPSVRKSMIMPSGSGGEDVSTHIPISDLPYSASGSTVGFLDDYNETCPSGGTGAPDVVYGYRPVYSQMVEVSLCGSS